MLVEKATFQNAVLDVLEQEVPSWIIDAWNKNPSKTAIQVVHEQLPSWNVSNPPEKMSLEETYQRLKLVRKQFGMISVNGKEVCVTTQTITKLKKLFMK